MMTYKKLIDLISFDLLSIQVWEHWIENGIEYVRPSDEAEIFEESNIGHIVLTEFKLNNKIEFIGFCSPQDSSGLDYIQPVIFSDKGQVEFWKDNGWTNVDKRKVFEQLGFKQRDIFPISFETKVKSDGNYFLGTILDFNK